MRRFLGTLVIAGVIVAGIGLYRGWFHLSKDDQPGETTVELRIDKQKVRADADAMVRRARNLRGGEHEAAEGQAPTQLDATERNETGTEMETPLP